jgi:uncharacterized membrane protein
MNWNTTGGSGIRITSVGHAAFAATMIGLGILGLIKGDFPPVWQPVPKSLPGREVLVYLCAFISLGCGIGLLWQRTAAVACRVLLIFLLLWLLVLRVPRIFISFTVDAWWASCQTAVMVAAAWVLYTWLASNWDRQRLAFATSDKAVRIARALYGIALIPFGLAHFIYLKVTADLVPNWLPVHVAWAYFTGGALIAAGVAVLIGLWARLAATMSAVEIGLFTLLVWVPIVAAGPNAFQWSEFVVSWALTATGWVVAESYRGMPWFGLGKPSKADFHRQ